MEPDELTACIARVEELLRAQHTMVDINDVQMALHYLNHLRRHRATEPTTGIICR